MNLENRAWGLKTLPHSGPGALNWSFLSPLSPVSGDFPGRTGEGKTLGGLPGFAYATVSQD